MELCSMLCGSQDGRGVWGEMDTCICIAESLHCSHETVTILLIDYTQAQNKKLKNFKKSKYLWKTYAIIINILKFWRNLK